MKAPAVFCLRLMSISSLVRPFHARYVFSLPPNESRLTAVLLFCQPICAGESAVNVAVGIDLAEPAAYMPCAFRAVFVSPVRIYPRHLAEGIVHTSVEAQFGMYRLVRNVIGEDIVQRADVDACAETATSVGARSDASLHVQFGNGRTDVRHVHPENALALGIIERHVLDGPVDTRVIASAHTEIGVAYTQTVIAGGHQRGSGTKQHRQVLSRVGTVQLPVLHLFVADGDLSDRRTHHDLLKVEITGGQCVHVLLRT